MPRVGFEPTIPVLEGAKSFRDSDSADTLIGYVHCDDKLCEMYPAGKYILFRKNYQRWKSRKHGSPKATCLRHLQQVFFFGSPNRSSSCIFEFSIFVCENNHYHCRFHLQFYW
jgi:hypothetical protein